MNRNAEIYGGTGTENLGKKMQQNSHNITADSREHSIDLTTRPQQYGPKVRLGRRYLIQKSTHRNDSRVL